MKKLSIFLLAVLLCMSVCFSVFADMGGPEFIGYTATAKSEIPYYQWETDDNNQSFIQQKGTIPAGTKLKIDNEYLMNGEMFAYFFNNEIRDEEGEAFNGYVRVRDLSRDDLATDSSVTAYKQSSAVRLRVTDPQGVTLYAGPSATYGAVGTVPQGAELTVDTLDQDGYASGAWMYVTYGGKSGWTCCWLFEGNDCSMAELLPKGETGTVWVVKDNAVLKDRNDNDLITVPKGEKLTFDSFNRYPHTLFFYVTYQGKSGYFTVDDDGYGNVVASNRNDLIVYSPPVLQDYTAKVYAYPDDKLPIGTVRYKAGDKLESEFLYYAEPGEYRGGIEWNYVEKDGQSGWIKTDHEKLETPEDYTEFSRDIPNLNEWGSAKKISVPVVQTTTAPETTATQPDDPAKPTASQAPDVENPQQTDTDDILTQTDESATELNVLFMEASTESETEAAIAVSGRPLSSAGIIGICIGAAAVLALTAFVTLRLIRRKKAD